MEASWACTIHDISLNMQSNINGKLRYDSIYMNRLHLASEKEAPLSQACTSTTVSCARITFERDHKHAL